MAMETKPEPAPAGMESPVTERCPICKAVSGVMHHRVLNGAVISMLGAIIVGFTLRGTLVLGSTVLMDLNVLPVIGAAAIVVGLAEIGIAVYYREKR